MILKNIRDRIGELLHNNNANNIKKLMRDKVDDFHLIEEVPMPVMIGGRLMFVGNLTLETLPIFIEKSAMIFASIGCVITTFDLFTNSGEMAKLILSNKNALKQLKELIKETVLKDQEYYEREIGRDAIERIKLPKVTWKHFNRNITLEKLIQILFLVYQYNFDAVKKNFKILAERMEILNLSEIYIYSWLENLVGLSGAFVKPQYPKLDSSVSENQKEEVKA